MNNWIGTTGDLMRHIKTLNLSLSKILAKRELLVKTTGSTDIRRERCTEVANQWGGHVNQDQGRPSIWQAFVSGIFQSFEFVIDKS